MDVQQPQGCQAWMSPTIPERAALPSEGTGSGSLGTLALYAAIHQILLCFLAQKKKTMEAGHVTLSEWAG